ncbi:MAG: hypothetical protein J5959_12635 [Butyrivibrio sp.]|nr:hypothetical protein [Butyrivibrio sp.]
MENKKFLFEEDSVWHALVVMALPAIASQLINIALDPLFMFVICLRLLCHI